MFKSPNLTQPELFDAGVARVGGRSTKNLPGRRGWGKTVSAPGGWGGMEVDGGMGVGSGVRAGMGLGAGVEDGFDVGEWAASEEF